jgi:histidyl-tRNA synthetase
MNEDMREKRRPENAELRRRIDKLMEEGDAFVKQNLEHLGISDYRYDINEAVVELSLEEEIVLQLIEDYVIQILKSKISFYKYIQELKKDILENKPLDYTNIRNLAHKNLGVVRNLRIKDAQKLLEVIMCEDDLDYLRLCVKALEISAVKLNPLCAYETLKLIAVKSSL